MTLGRPVKWIESRRENLMAANHAREVGYEIEIGFDADGRILAIRALIRADIGAYVRTAALVPAEFGAALLPGPYRVPNYACDLWSVVTNKTPARTPPSPGRPGCHFVPERAAVARPRGPLRGSLLVGRGPRDGARADPRGGERHPRRPLRGAARRRRRRREGRRDVRLARHADRRQRRAPRRAEADRRGEDARRRTPGRGGGRRDGRARRAGGGRPPRHPPRAPRRAPPRR